MSTDILISGFGGQGLMSLGKIIARAALIDGKATSWFPSYGAEMRGGTAHCYVKVSNTPIASPFVEYADIAVILNQPSLDKFKKRMKKDSLLIINSDLINKRFSFKDIDIISLPLNAIALECGNLKVVNSVVLGILTVLRPSIFKKSTLAKVLKSTFFDKEILKANFKGLDKGQELARK